MKSFLALILLLVEILTSEIMNTKGIKIVYWVSTGLLSALMLMSAGMYFFNYEMVSETFIRLGYPAYIIYPLAIAKILGLVAIWTRKFTSLKEWAYAGFFFDFLLAFSAHIAKNDNEYVPSALALVLLMVSYFCDKKLWKKK